MANEVIFGVDVAKDELVIHDQASGLTECMDNTAASITRWVSSRPDGCVIALEATGTYHVELAQRAHAHGHTVFVIDGYQLAHYRHSVRTRAKTDRCDAQLLARFVSAERDRLRAWHPPPEAYVALQRLLRRRAVLVRARVAIEQSCESLPELKPELARLRTTLTDMDALIKKRIKHILREAGLAPQAERCRAIKGVGELTSAGLVMAFLRGSFRTSDAFVAFLGLDVRVKDSGASRGRRTLSKRGDPELRRLLHSAAMAASRSGQGKQLYEQYRARGLKSTEALVILARKIARVAFALMKNQTVYRPPECASKACVQT